MIEGTGAWSPGPPQPGWVGADGNLFPWPDNFLNLTDIGLCGSCAHTNAPHWAALIGYIGTNPPAVGSYTSPSILPEALKVFLVGSRLVTDTVQTGPLWLNFNDDAYSGATGDNRGQLTAQVSVNSPGSALLDLPWAYDGQPQTFRNALRDSDDGGYIWSWFDHNRPTYCQNSSLLTFTGIPLTTVTQGSQHSTCPQTNVGPVDCYSGRCYDGHDGIDFSGMPSTMIEAAADGVVVDLKEGCIPQHYENGCSGYGNYVILYHPQVGIFTRYGHLASISVTINQPVTMHQQIGVEGSTGNSRGTHLHFGVYKDQGVIGRWEPNNDPAIDPFGWNGTDADPWAADPLGAASTYLWRERDLSRGAYDPAQPFTLAASTSRATVLIPAYALPGAAILELATDDVPGPDQPWRSTGHSAVLRVLPTGPVEGPSPISFSQPASITIAYSDTDVIRLDTARLTMFRWDMASSSWLPLSTHLVPSSHLAWAQTTEPGPFALFAPLACTTDLWEPDETFAYAPMVIPGQGSLSRSFDRSDDQDWVRMDVTHGITYTFATSALTAGMDTLLRLYDLDGTTLLASADSNGGASATITWRAPTDSTVFVQVQNGSGGSTGCTATYNFTVAYGCGLSFSDVQPTDYFYPAVQYLTCIGALSGYPDGTFRPYNNATRGQVSKIFVLAQGLPINTTGGPHFQDVPPTGTFYPYIETLYNRNVVGGYPCGGPGEPCVPPDNRSYFRPNNNVTRGQLCKIIVTGELWPIDTGGGPHFTDVTDTNTFYHYVETMYNRGIIGGYPCGGPFEPCVPPTNRPYFRPTNNAVRGQIAKIVYNALTVPPPSPVQATNTAVPTHPPTIMATVTPLPSATNTPIPTSIRTTTPNTTSTRTATWTHTVIPGISPTWTPTWTNTPVSSNTPTWTPSWTSSATWTRTWTPTWTPTWTTTPTPTWTRTGTPTWTATPSCEGVVPSPNLGGGSNELLAVAALATNNAWAVGTGPNSAALLEHWDGNQWSLVSSPVTGTLQSIAAVAPNDIWAVGHQGTWQPLIEHWNGNAWSVVPAPSVGTGSQLHGVAAVAANDVWAVGEYNAGGFTPQTLTLHWNGTSWSSVPSPNPGSAGLDILYAVAVHASNDVWAVGAYFGSGPTGLMYRTLTLHWNGSSWSEVPSVDIGQYVSNLYAVDMVSSTDVWAVGLYHDDSAQPFTLIEHWNGTAWSLVPGPDLGTTPNSLKGVLALAANNVWAVGSAQDGTSLVLQWNGSAWNRTPSAAGHLNGLAASAPSYVWAVGSAQGNTLTERWACAGFARR